MVDAKHHSQWERAVIAFLAAAWGCGAVLPFVALVRRISAAERLQKLTPRRVRRGRIVRAVDTIEIDGLRLRRRQAGEVQVQCSVARAGGLERRH